MRTRTSVLLVTWGLVAVPLAGCNNTDNPRPNEGGPVGPGTTAGGLGDRNITADNRDTMPPNQGATPSGDTNSANPGTSPGPMTPPHDKGPLPPPGRTVTPTPQTPPK